MAQAAPARPVERVRNFYNRVGLPPVSEWMTQFTTRARQAQEAGDPTLVDRAKRQCSGMLGFTQYRFPRYRPSDVHRVVCAQLERVEAREIDRLMLLMPPRHGKSELASKSYPAWSIGRKPWKQFISGSASMPLAQDWGREVRNIVNSDAFQLVFETRLSPDSQAAGKWNTQQGGSYYSVGVEGGVMGRGAHDIMLDDLYANTEEAASPVIREKVWKWYSGTIYNRLEPGGAIVLINHRMHEDDLSGRLIEKMKSGDSDADQWTIIRLPAIADDDHDLLGRAPGDPLWPEHFGLPVLARIRANTFARDFSALYQRQPTPDEGEFFAPDRMELRTQQDDVIVWVRAWDLSGTVDGDWSVGVMMGLTRDKKVVVGDVKRLRGRPEKVAELVEETARGDTRRVKICLPQDPGQAGIAQVEFYTKLLNGFILDISPESGMGKGGSGLGKQTRAKPFAVQVNNHNVELIVGDWNQAYREELRAFPYGKFDDQVDASSRAHMVLTSGRQPMKISDSVLAGPGGERSWYGAVGENAEDRLKRQWAQAKRLGRGDIPDDVPAAWL